jgi:hypothetical protein
MNFFGLVEMVFSSFKFNQVGVFGCLNYLVFYFYVVYKSISEVLILL